MVTTETWTPAREKMEIHMELGRMSCFNEQLKRRNAETSFLVIISEPPFFVIVGKILDPVIDVLYALVSEGAYVYVIH